MTPARKIEPHGEIDRKTINTVRISKVAPPNTTLRDYGVETDPKPISPRVRFITNEISARYPSPEFDGIAKLCQQDLFIALLVLTVLNAGVYVYYHLLSPTQYSTKTAARIELEVFLPTKNSAVDSVLKAVDGAL